MTFTYIGDLSTDLDEIRFTIGDTIEDDGVKPGTGSATNFSDEEIEGLLLLEGSVIRAVGRIYQTLANIWSRYVDSKIGPRDEKLSKIADNWRKQWQDHVKQHGTSGTDIVLGYLVENLDQEEEDVYGDSL
jgi:hypothetical protein